MGLAENVPNILLREAFLAEDSDNIFEWDGLYKKMPGRIPMLYDSSGDEIVTPKLHYTVTAVDQGTKTFTITGNNKAAIDAEISADDTFRINGSTGNDQLFTFVSATDSGGDTLVVVSEAISDATGDGYMFVGYTPIIATHQHYTTSDTELLFVGTAYHVFRWVQASKLLVLEFTSGTPSSVLQMQFTSHLNWVYMTNNVDKIQEFDAEDFGSKDFAVANTASGLKINGTYIVKAKWIFSYETYLFVGNVTISNGDVEKDTIYWASRGTVGASVNFDVTDTAADAGTKAFANEDSECMGFGRKGDDLIVAKASRMHRGYLVTSDDVFRWSEEKPTIGCMSGFTIVNDKAGRLYWLANDYTIRELDTPFPISALADVTVRKLNAEKSEYAQAAFIDFYGQVWFSLTTQDSETNNVVVAYDPDNNQIYTYNFAIRCFGKFSRQEVMTYDTLPYATYTEWGAAWLVYDTRLNRVGWPIEVGCDYDGKAQEMIIGVNDDSATHTGTIILSTTCTQEKTPFLYKRISAGADLYFNTKDTGSATLYKKEEQENSWTSLGTASFVDADEPEIVRIHIPFHARARDFNFKIESSDEMEFLGMILREVDVESDR
jgi:hypothetical protein